MRLRSARTRPGRRTGSSTSRGRRTGSRRASTSRHKAEVERLLDRFEQEHRVRAHRAPAAGADLQARVGGGAAAPLRRPVPAEFARAARSDPVRAGRAAASLPGGRTRTTSARRTGWRRPATRAAPSTSRPIPSSTRTRSRACCTHARCRCRRACSAARPRVTWKLRLQPSPPGWIDLALQTPLLDSSRARNELGWSPRFTVASGAGGRVAGHSRARRLDTPPLEPSESRVDEVVGRGSAAKSDVAVHRCTATSVRAVRAAARRPRAAR